MTIILDLVDIALSKPVETLLFTVSTSWAGAFALGFFSAAGSVL